MKDADIKGFWKQMDADENDYVSKRELFLFSGLSVEGMKEDVISPEEAAKIKARRESE
jgi:hypothetical protein